MYSSLRTPIITILFIFVALFVYTKLAGPIPFTVNSINTNKESLFRADGTGKATAVPNTAQVSVGVTKQAATVADAQNQVNTVANTLIANVKALGIEEKNITTTNYNVSPNYDYTNGRQSVNGYTVTQTIDIEVTPVEKANQVLDASTKAGANIVNNVTFVLDEKTKKKILKEAREKAVEAAKEKAESLAAATGIKLGRIVDVYESYNQPILYRPEMSAVKNQAEPAVDSTQLTPGESTVEITITLSYETY